MRPKAPPRIGRLGNTQPIALYFFALVGAVSFVIVITLLITLRTQEQTTVPDVLGNRTATALLSLQERDLIPRVRLAYDDDPLTTGTIIRQSPSPGANVRAGKEITLTISRGRAVFGIESFIGQSIEEVNLSIQKIELRYEASIQIGDVIYVPSDEPAGTVLEQSPLPDSEVGIFTQLDLVVSLGAEQARDTVVVPDLRNAHFESAIESLLRKGIQFRFFTSNSAPSTDNAYRVVRQSSPPGSILTDGQLALTIASPAAVDLGFSFGIYEYIPPTDTVLDQNASFIIRATTSDDQQRTLAQYRSLPQLVSIPYLLPEKSLIELITGNTIIDSLIVE